MSTATAPDYVLPRAGGNTHFLLRRLHSLTGLIFGGYLVIHLIVNATLAQGAQYAGGPTVYQVEVDKIHSLPYLWAWEWVFIYLPILYHSLYGIWIIVTGRPNSVTYGYAKNWMYTLQRISALVLIFFIAFHIMAMKGMFGGDVGHALTFNPLKATQTTARHMNVGWWVWGVIYPIGILASCYHLANGVWTAGVTWGLTVSAKAQRRWGMVSVILFFITLICGLTALIALIQMGSPA